MFGVSVLVYATSGELRLFVDVSLLMVDNCWFTTVGCWFTPVGCRLMKVVGEKLSVHNSWLKLVACRLMVVG